jgi:hypothetical protein
MFIHECILQTEEENFLSLQKILPALRKIFSLEKIVMPEKRPSTSEKIISVWRKIAYISSCPGKDLPA